MNEGRGVFVLNTNSAPFRHKGNEGLFLAVEMSVISTMVGIPLHVHAEGLRGTGKTTVMRFAARHLPRITRIRGCLYYCEAENPHCPEHARGKSPGGWETEEVTMPFTEIGHAAKLGTVVGSIDLARLTDPSHPEASLLPGSIPQASRGIVFVDEINRLAETSPEITDVLLSVMGTKPGKLTIEETGLPPVEIEVRASVWAASNPDEDPGPLEHVRRQLADRFDLVVAVNRPTDPDVVEKMLSKRLDVSPQADPDFLKDLAAKAQRFRSVTVSRSILRYIAELYVSRNIESLRAVESLELCSRLTAAIRGRDEVTVDDLLTVAPMVLRHRVEPLVLAEILKDLEGRKQAAGSWAGHRDRDDRSRPEVRERGEGRCPRAEEGAAYEPQANGGDRKEGARAAAGYSATGGPPGGSGQPGDTSPSNEVAEDGLFRWLRSTFRRWLGFAPVHPPEWGGGVPSSPPDVARPISSVGWHEMILPGVWNPRDEPQKERRV